MSARQPLFLGIEAATPNLWPLQRALEEHHLPQVGAALRRQQGGVVRRLRCPDGIELALEKAAFGIKPVARLLPAGSVGATRWPDADEAAVAGIVAAPLAQHLADRARVELGELHVERRDTGGDHPLFVVALVSLAVRFEAAALVEVEQRPPQVKGRQLFVQRPRPQRVHVLRNRAECLVVRLRHQRFPRFGRVRHQPVLDQRIEHRAPPPLVPIPAPRHLPRQPPPLRQRRPRLRFPAIAIDANAGIRDPPWFALLVES